LTARHRSAIFPAVRPLIWLTLGLAACSAATQQPTAPTPASQTSTPIYHVRPGDILRIVVWGQEAYSGEYQIDERGILEYPVVGELDTRDLTVAELRDRIRHGLETIFNSPFVTVRPQFRMAVLGRVERPGLYVVDPTVSVLDLVAMAGGAAPGGNLNGVKLRRDGAELRLALEGGIKGHTLQEIGVRSGDQIIVPRRFFTREDVFLLLQVTQLIVSVAILVQTY
jgi:polysaccharide export outer membrane protein